MTAVQTTRRLRHPVKLPASIKSSCGLTSSAIVSDFSLDGCCVSGFFKVGELLEVNIRSIGSFSAQVCWSRMGKAGARFLHERSFRPAPTAVATCERGTSAIEYAILAAGIAVALVVAIGGLGGRVSGTWGDVDTAVPGPSFNSGSSGNETD